MGKREYINCGNGTCQFGNRCRNYKSDECYVCMFNTNATTRDYFDAISEKNEMDNEERDMIES